MNCKNCGELLEEGAAVCPNCGEGCEVAENVKEETMTEETVAEEPRETVCGEAAETPAEESEISEEGEGLSYEFLSEEGTEVLEETAAEAAPVSPKKKTLLRVLAAVCCAALALALGLGVWMGMNGGLKPRANDVQRLDSYSAEGEKLLNAMDTVVAACGDAQLTNGVLQILYWNEVYRFLEEAGSYLSYMGLDLTKSLAEQYATEGGLSYQQELLRSALNNWHSYQALAKRGKAEGFQLSEASALQLASMSDSLTETALYYGMESAEELIQADMGPGATLEAYLDYLELYFYAMEYFDSVYLSMNPSQEEVSAYYDANSAAIDSTYGVSKDSGKLIDVRHILVMPKGGTKDEQGNTTYSDEEWEACRQAGEALLKQWKEGAADEAFFATLATENTEDPGSQSTGGLYTNVYQGQMVPEFNDWCFDESRQYGDTGLVRTDYGYHVMFYVAGEDGWYRAARQNMISEECTKLLQDAMADTTLEVEYRKIRLGEAKLG